MHSIVIWAGLSIPFIIMRLLCFLHYLYPYRTYSIIAQKQGGSASLFFKIKSLPITYQVNEYHDVKYPTKEFFKLFFRRRIMYLKIIIVRQMLLRHVW